MRLKIYVITTLFILSAIGVIVLNLPKQKETVTIKNSDFKVYINGLSVPAYSIDDSIFVATENLGFTGLDVTLNKDRKTLIISPPERYYVTESDAELVFLNTEEPLHKSEYKVKISDKDILSYSSKNNTIIPISELEVFGKMTFSDNTYFYELTKLKSDKVPDIGITKRESNGIIIVLDPGHGKASSTMTNSERENFGWIYNEEKEEWGEWRHFKTGTVNDDCYETDCSGRVPENGSCWYKMVNSDREYEPQINLKNALSAKKYLEDLGYTVRLTRENNTENPSITKRLSFCFPDNDTSVSPDATVFISIHSNAGGGCGSSYIEASGEYDNPYIPSDYVEKSNLIGEYINSEICKNTSLIKNPPIPNGELIAFLKSPVICGYMEIGFYDNPSDLEILNNENDAIGKGIAVGIDKFIQENIS